MSGALSNTAFTIYGNLTASTGMTVNAGTQVITFAATSGTKTINTAGVTFDKSFTFNGVGGTWQLQAALTSGATRACTLTNGTLDLNGYTATFGSVSSSNSNARTFAFGSTGKFVLLNTAVTVWTTSTATNLTVTGTNPLIQLTTAATTGTRVFAMGVAGEANAISFSVTAGSDIVQLTVSTGAYKNINLTGFTGTLNFGNSINFYGNFDVGGATSMTGTGNPFFAATSGTKTIRSNALSFPASLTFNGVGGTWSLQDAISAVTTLTLTNGTLTTNGYAVTAGVFSSNNANVRALNLGASTVTITGTGTSWNFTDPTNLTFNAGTSSIVFTGTTGIFIFANGGKTYYNVTAPDSGYRFDVVGSAVFNQLTVPNSSTAAEKTLRFDTNQTIGTFTVTGANGNCRILVFANPPVVGAQITLTATSVSLVDADFRDIAAAGAAIPWTGTRLGNYGNNTNITFGAGQTVYWNKVAGGSWGDDAWALTSGGATWLFLTTQD